MELDTVSETIGGQAGQARKLKNKAVESCLEITGDLPRLYDLVYEKFPQFYNDGTHRFGRRNVVKMYDPEKVKQLKMEEKDASGYTSIRPLTPFFQRASKDLKWKYPDALVIPFVTALSALMKVEDGRVVWAHDNIDAVVLEKLKKAAPLFEGQLEAYSWDPQRLAKNGSSHMQAASYYSVL